ncbi:MAG TPA: hypothetical protein EYN66_23660 [Myxococcales bacterium]|nr:hypothetical protein [Myxococcales bacterium]
MNFGNPEKPEIMWQFSQAIDGMSDACVALDAPVIGGNVSFYNETDGKGILPTLMVGVVGFVDDMTDLKPSAAFLAPGHKVAVLGNIAGETLGGGEYIYSCHGLTRGVPPKCNLDLEKAVSQACRTLVRSGAVASAHDISDGGLFAALAECTGAHNGTRVGAQLTLQSTEDITTALFGEAGARIVVSYTPENAAAVQQVATEQGVALTELGSTGGDTLNLNLSGRSLSLGLDTLFERWDNGLTEALGIKS